MSGLEKIVNDDAVFKIADRLTAEGKKVSNRVVWAEVGGGSMTTIAAALRRWRERRKKHTEHSDTRNPIPVLLIDAMHDTVNLLWRTAQDEVQKEINRLIQSMNYCVAETIVERDEALSELQQVVEDLQNLQTPYVSSETQKVCIEDNLAVEKEITRVTFDLEKETHCRLKIYAVQKGKSVTDILRELITKELG